MIPLVAAVLIGLVLGMIFGFAICALVQSGKSEDEYLQGYSDARKAMAEELSVEPDTRTVTVGDGTRNNPYRTETHVLGCGVIVGGKCNCGEILTRSAL